MPSLTDPWPPAPKPDHASLDYATLTDFLVKSGIGLGVITMLDTEYSLPAEQWITGKFAKAFTTVLTKLEFNYRPESRDCDDFARLAGAYVQLLHSRNTSNVGAYQYQPRLRVIAPIGHTYTLLGAYRNVKGTSYSQGARLW
jgi:hypothetical protein